MEKLLKKMVLPSILISVLLLVLGIVVFIYPETTLELMAKIIGAGVIALGIIGIIQYVNHKDEESFRLNIFYAMAVIILGIVTMCSYKFVSSIIPIILGIWIVIDSLIKLRLCIGIKDAGISRWVYPFVMSFVTLVIGIFLIFNPFESAIAITKIGAILIIVSSVIDIIQDVMVIKYVD